MKKFLKYFLAIAGVMVLFASCEKEEKVWTGVQVGFERATANLMIPIEVSTTHPGVYKVALIAAPQAQDITVSFDVDPASTAVEGTHFNISSKTATIPAGQNFAEFTITAINSGFAFGGDFKRLILAVKESSADVAVNFSKLTLTISKEAFIDKFAGTFAANEWYDGEHGYGPYNVTTTVIPGTNSINLMGVYDWATQAVKFDFNPDNNTITVARQVFNPGVGSGLGVQGTGKFDLANQTFELDAIIYNGNNVYDIVTFKYSRPTKSSSGDVVISKADLFKGL
jgi:hypothetical protein